MIGELRSFEVKLPEIGQNREMPQADIIDVSMIEFQHAQAVQRPQLGHSQVGDRDRAELEALEPAQSSSGATGRCQRSFHPRGPMIPDDSIP